MVECRALREQDQTVLCLGMKRERPSIGGTRRGYRILCRNIAPVRIVERVRQHHTVNRGRDRDGK